MNKLIPKCNNGSIPLSGGGKIPNNHIEKILESFKNASPEQVITKTILSDCFLPNIPREKSRATGFLPTIYVSDGNVKKNFQDKINKKIIVNIFNFVVYSCLNI